MSTRAKKKKTTKRKTKKKSSKREEVTRAELARLSYCNSDRIPNGCVEIDGRAMRWVGIGWVDEGPATGKETMVVNG